MSTTTHPAPDSTSTPTVKQNKTRSIAIGEARPQGWLYLTLGIGLVVMLTPFIWMVLSAFKPEAEIRANPPTWWPQTFTLDNFTELFTRLNFPQFFTNSAVVAVLVTLGNLVFCSMLGYAFAKIDFWGRDWLFRIVLGTMMVPGIVMLVPLFVLVSRLGLVNSYAGLILPFLAGPFGVFLMRQFISALPDELIDAGRIDGASEFRIFARIIMPLCKPALATLGILTFLGSWNNFLWPLVVASSEDKYTLPVALALYSTGQNENHYGLMLAGAVAVVAPVLIVFLFLQKQIIQGIATSGIK
ncbi:MAG: carbohydrate ABC transporter permease [Cellulomonas sp.]